MAQILPRSSATVDTSASRAPGRARFAAGAAADMADMRRWVRCRARHSDQDKRELTSGCRSWCVVLYYSVPDAARGWPQEVAAKADKAGSWRSCHYEKRCGPYNIVVPLALRSVLRGPLCCCAQSSHFDHYPLTKDENKFLDIAARQHATPRPETGRGHVKTIKFVPCPQRWANPVCFGSGPPSCRGGGRCQRCLAVHLMLLAFCTYVWANVA